MKWTADKLDTLVRCYPLAPTDQLAELLDMSSKQVAIMAHALNVKKIHAQTVLQLDKLEAKKCSMCECVKLLEDFSFNKFMSSNHNSHCLLCVQE